MSRSERKINKLLRRFQRSRRYYIAADYARKLPDSVLSVKFFNLCYCFKVIGLLFNKKMIFSKGGNLSKMSDADDLLSERYFTQLCGNFMSRPSADAGIYFVKNHCALVSIAREYAAHGKHYP